MNLKNKEQAFQEYFDKFGEFVSVYTGAPKTPFQSAVLLVVEEGEDYKEVAKAFDIDEQELHLTSTCQRLHNRWLDELG